MSRRINVCTRDNGLVVAILFLVAATTCRIVPCHAWMRTTLSDRLMGRMSPPPTSTATLMYAMQKPSSSSSSSSAAATTKQNQREMLDFIEQPMDSVTPSSSSSSSSSPLINNNNNNNNNTPLGVVPVEQDPVADLVRCIVRAADGRKAEDIVAMRVSHVSTLTTFLVILSGNSRPQNQAIAAAITKDVQQEFGNDMKPGGTGVPEGSPESGWMVLDYGSVMVHIMTPKSRLYYNVQGQWQDKGGEYMDLSNLLIPNSAVLGGSGANIENGDNNAATSTNNGYGAEQAEDDPFWS